MNLINPSINLKAFLFFFHSTITIIISFLPLFLQEKGLSNTEIGWILAIGPLAAIFSQPLWGFLSDKYKSVKRVLLTCLIGMFLFSILLFSVSSFLAFVISAFLFFFFMTPVGALGDSLSQKTADQQGISFGSIRMWGSVGFAVTSLLCGQIFSYIGVGNIMIPYVFYAIVSILICLSIIDVKVSKKPVHTSGALELIKDKRISIFLLIIILISITHRTNDSFIGIHMMDIGAETTLIGWAWFIGVLTEAIVFGLSAFWYKKYHELTFIILAGFLYGIRFIAVSFIQDPVHLLFLQPLHGICFGLFYTAAFKYMTKVIPEELLGTGHLLFVSVFFGFSGILGSLGGGYIMEATNGAVLYKTLGYTALLGSIGMFFFKLYGPNYKSEKVVKILTDH
jgi:PPP family 3-phenylpropionic acid transporter